jgi:tetratricopeptide (TPR) repeat protein
MGSTPHGTMSGRLDIYNYALNWISASPFLGHGTGNVPELYALRGYAIGGDEVYHSHNFWLEITLESGIVGVILIIAMLVSILWAFRSSWIEWREDSVVRPTLAATAGAGSVFLIHGLFDWQLWEASYVLALAVILALIYSLTTTKHVFHIPKRYIVVTLIILLMTSFIILMSINRSQSIFWDGKIEASRGNWVSAEEKICRAADSSSNNPFYSFQCSLANAHLAKLNQDENALKAAYQYQLQAIDLEPNWYVHWANLASYELQLGDFESAITHMQKAVDLAPNRVILRLSLAGMLENAGESDQAFQHFQHALCSNPRYQNAMVFQDSPSFQTAGKMECPEGIFRWAFIDNMWAGDRALDIGDFKSAEQNYRRAMRYNGRSGAPFAMIAWIQQQKGENLEDSNYLQTAFFIENNSALNHEIAGKILLNDGNFAEGFDHLYQALLIRRTNAFSRVFYAYEYFDAGLHTDLSPFIPNSMSIETFALYEQLAEYLTEQGESKKHQLVTQWLDLIRPP